MKADSVVAKQRKPTAGGKSPAERVEVMYNVEDPTLGLCQEDYEHLFYDVPEEDKEYEAEDEEDGE